jgi:hypothetical protein
VCGEVGGSTSKPLTTSWNGTTWKTTTSADPSNSVSILFGVSCASATSCQTVGHYEKNSTTTQLALIESWNGTKWSLATTTDPSTSDNDLASVSCFSAANCVAVGSYAQGPDTETFSDSWNGRTWIVFKPADPGGSLNLLSGVACPTAATSQAVGNFTSYPGAPAQTLAETATTVAPVIKNFTPASGKPGITVTINGDHFDGVTAVTFNGTSATITSLTSDQLKVTVPAAASTGKIKVTSPGGSATSTTNFTVT